MVSRRCRGNNQWHPYHWIPTGPSSSCAPESSLASGVRTTITEVDVTDFERVGPRGCSVVQVLAFGDSSVTMRWLRSVPFCREVGPTLRCEWS